MTEKQQEQSNTEAIKNSSQAQASSESGAFNSQLQLPPGVILQQAPPNVTMSLPHQLQNQQVIMSSLPAAMAKSSTRGATNVQGIPAWVSNQVVRGQPPYQYPTPGMDSQSPMSPSVVSNSLAQVSFLSEASQVQRKSAKSPKKKPKSEKTELSQEVKAQQNRERNREHARSTRLRKKAYVQQLKEMAEGLREIQTTEIRQRRMAAQKMMDIKVSRRRLVQTVLAYHAAYESDPSKWRAVIEESFWFKQPVTPFRSFRRSEVEKVSISLCFRRYTYHHC